MKKLVVVVVVVAAVAAYFWYAKARDQRADSALARALCGGELDAALSRVGIDLESGKVQMNGDMRDAAAAVEAWDVVRASSLKPHLASLSRLREASKEEVKERASQIGREMNALCPARFADADKAAGRAMATIFLAIPPTKAPRS